MKCCRTPSTATYAVGSQCMPMISWRMPPSKPAQRKAASRNETESDGKAFPKSKSTMSGMELAACSERPAMRANVSCKVLLSRKLRPGKKPRWAAGADRSMRCLIWELQPAAISFAPLFFSASGRVVAGDRTAPAV
eukprot:8526768-Pyramimonas_sp.AAC.1